MATHGHIGEFDRRAEDWMVYCERLKQYFLANNIVDGAKQRAVLLSVCWAGTYVPAHPQPGSPRQTNRQVICSHR